MTGTTVVTVGVVETGVKVVASIIGVVVMPGLVVASDRVVTVGTVVTAIGSGIKTFNIPQVQIEPRRQGKTYSASTDM